MAIEHPERKIRQIRELQDITQEYMADNLGISTRAYSKIETGETQLTIGRLNQISEILKVEPIQILGFDDKKIFNFNNTAPNSTWHNYEEYHNSPSEKLIEQYEATIEALNGQITLLKQILQEKE
ncbi:MULTISPECIES: helix-turn-helix domain-containing protein [unclassified Porphyromonas]|uniref:helix-turn-helix domain-containing protein n=1 Tax=unclassified Porphyromonas TaxID=2645799 RepID=UPI00052B9665|nr:MULTISPECIES: helix-turn-helix domain-containing protein [unclassified Porphyromonas]KGN69590.1 DNA-binding helix-turn-helix protein [Porphyromonas sp. COT-108 OH1349]KGN96173.1 DNA-binding helix-turn-helix protein [Porphyromonas sp. COT-108 OH2963]